MSWAGSEFSEDVDSRGSSSRNSLATYPSRCSQADSSDCVAIHGTKHIHLFPPRDDTQSLASRTPSFAASEARSTGTQVHGELNQPQQPQDDARQQNTIEGSITASPSPSGGKPRNVFISYFPDPAIAPSPIACPSNERDSSQKYEDEQYSLQCQRVEEHQLKIRQLVEFLQNKGVQCVVDFLVDESEEIDWATWLETAMTSCDVVLMIMTSSYTAYLSPAVPTSLADYTTHPYLFDVQGSIVNDFLTRPRSNGVALSKFIPVFLDTARKSTALIPRALRNGNAYALPFPLELQAEGSSAVCKKDIDRLYMRLTGQKQKRPVLGQVQDLPQKKPGTPLRIRQSHTPASAPISAPVRAQIHPVPVRSRQHAVPQRPPPAETRHDNLPAVQHTCTVDPVLRNEVTTRSLLSPEDVHFTALEDWQDGNGTLLDFDAMPTEIILQDLCHFVSQNWMSLVRELGITDVCMQQIMVDYASDSREQFFQCLVLWLSQSGRQASYRRLCESLVVCGQTAEVSKLAGLVSCR